MSDFSFEEGAAERFAARLHSAKAKLGRPYEDRWRWRRKRSRYAKVSKALREATPATVMLYDGAKQRVIDISRDLRRTRRRHVSWMWVRIVFASLWAFVRRARMVILFLAVIAGLSVAGYYFGTTVIRFLTELSPVLTPAVTNPDSRSSGVR